MTSKEQFNSSRGRTRCCKRQVVSAIARKNRCDGAKVIWQRRRGSRIRGAGSGRSREGMPCICPKNGIAYMASIQERARRLGKNGCSAFIRRIEPSGREQLIEQLLGRRITKWNCESLFPIVRFNTSIH